eukprot:1140669-Pyramimonas_sp.AAC.1
MGAVRHMRTLPLWPSKELLMELRDVRGVCRNSRGGAMRTLPLEPSAEFPTRPRTCEGCAEISALRHASPPTKAFSGAPNGATKRLTGAPK